MTSLDNSVRITESFTVNVAGIVIKQGDLAAQRYGEKLKDWLEARSIRTLYNQIDARLDLLIILGGDGTLLHVAETAAQYEIPVIGINLGNLGFLTELTESETESALTQILSGSVRMENRLMLKARLLNIHRETSYRHALNDIVINKNAVDRLLNLSTAADNEYITTYKADGLIFSSPTGSTAYNLSAGGPIVHPGLATILVTPICPFMLSSRPIILPANTTITSQFQAGDIGAAARVIIDGQDAWEMRPGDILEVRKAEHPLQLVTSSERDYFTILRTKLKWASND